jgi:hypothetical protein
MENGKIITIAVDEEQIKALQTYLFNDITGDEQEVLKYKICTLLRSIEVAYENTTKYVDMPDNLDQSQKLIEVQRTRICELEKEEIAFPYRMYLALGELLDCNPEYQLLSPAEINVFDEEFNIYRRNFKIIAKDIICINTVTKRKKAIYVRYENEDGSISIRRYIFNSNEYNFDTLCRFIDPLAHRLIRISKTAIVNVAYFEIASDNYLYLTTSRPELSKVELIKISEKKSEYDTFKNDFINVKGRHRNRVLEQKRILGYMFQVDSFEENNFTP